LRSRQGLGRCSAILGSLRISDGRETQGSDQQGGDQSDRLVHDFPHKKNRRTQLGMRRGYF
jgi:hypothetical protein